MTVSTVDIAATGDVSDVGLTVSCVSSALDVVALHSAPSDDGVQLALLGNSDSSTDADEEACFPVSATTLIRKRLATVAELPDWYKEYSYPFVLSGYRLGYHSYKVGVASGNS